MSKFVTTTNDLNKPKHPLQSSFLVQGANQWLLTDILTQWEGINEKDPQFITDALSTVQSNVSLALSCIQAQLQSMTAPVTREGEEGISYLLKCKRQFGIILFNLK